MLLRAESVSKSFGPKTVLNSVTINLDKGDRLGLLGRNGAGKTTLLKILMRHLKPDSGEITINTDKIGYLSQTPVTDPTMKVGTVIGTPYGHLGAIANQILELEDQLTRGAESGMSTIEQHELAQKYARLQEEFGGAGGFGIDSRARSALTKVGLAKDIIDRRLGTLSGGEITKVFLARVLVQADDVDLIFLDEPTSHLDMETVEWLEKYLKELNACLILVSHDRYFLDNIISQVIELDNGSANLYSGNYTQFLEKKAHERELMEKAYKKYRTEANRQARIAEQQHQRWTYFSLHKTRKKMLERHEKVSAPKQDKELRFKIEAANKSGKNMLIAQDLSIYQKDRIIVENVNLDIEVGDKLGIFGPNGSGKTTLLKALLSKLESKGELWLAPGVSLGYFAQGHDTLDNALTPEKQLLKALGSNELLQARTILGSFMISGRDAGRPIRTLSGGERARVALAMLIAERRNLLILDEPTNYLDIPSRHAVENALIEYPGTLIVVTHDRYFLDSVCDKVGELKNGALEIFAGTYSEMKDAMGKVKKSSENDEYIVVSGFKDWTTGKKYKVGEILHIPDDEREKFSWALGSSRLKKKTD